MADRKDWCEVCYKNYLESMRKRIGKDKNVFFDLSKISFRCKIPTFTHDHYGFPIVVVRDCANKRDIVFPQAEWLKKRAAGEL